MDEVGALTRRLDLVEDKRRVDRNALMRTQQYTLELEARMEALEEVVTRLIEREHPMVQDAVEATLEQLIAETDYDNTDLQRLLDTMVPPADLDEFMDMMEDNDEM